MPRPIPEEAQVRARITIEMDGAAFDSGPQHELARILHTLANKISDEAPMLLPLLDGNGNKVGSFKIEEKFFGRRSVRSRFPKGRI